MQHLENRMQAIHILGARGTLTCSIRWVRSAHYACIEPARWACAEPAHLTRALCERGCTCAPGTCEEPSRLMHWARAK